MAQRGPNRFADLPQIPSARLGVVLFWIYPSRTRSCGNFLLKSFDQQTLTFLPSINPKNAMPWPKHVVLVSQRIRIFVTVRHQCAENTSHDSAFLPNHPTLMA